MHEQSIIDCIVNRLDTADLKIKKISLICDERTLRERLKKDIDAGVRSAGITGRSTARIPMYQRLDTIKIDTSGKSVEAVAEEIEKI